MFFNVSGHEVKVEVEKKKVFLSKHSERKLKKFKIHFQVYNPLKIPKTVTSIDDKKNGMSLIPIVIILKVIRWFDIFLKLRK